MMNAYMHRIWRELQQREWKCTKRKEVRLSQCLMLLHFWRAASTYRETLLSSVGRCQYRQKLKVPSMLLLFLVLWPKDECVFG